MKRFTLVALVIAVTVGLLGSLAAATPQTQYPTPGTWMADCPSAPRADYVAYHRIPQGYPGGGDWCNLVVDQATLASSIVTVAAPIEGIGMTPFTSWWDSSPLHNVVVVRALQTPTEEQAHLQALYDLIDARIALVPGSGPTQAEFDALLIEVNTAKVDLAATQADLLLAQTDIGTLETQVAVLQGLFSSLDTKQTNIYDSLKAFYAAFDPTQ